MKIYIKLNEHNRIAHYVQHQENIFDAGGSLIERQAIPWEDAILVEYDGTDHNDIGRNKDKFTFSNGKIFIVEEQLTIKQIDSELQEILEWFKSKDYYINKVFLGEWLSTDERYVSYLSERQLKRERQDFLENSKNLSVD